MFSFRNLSQLFIDIFVEFRCCIVAFSKIFIQNINKTPFVVYLDFISFYTYIDIEYIHLGQQDFAYNR